MVALVTPPTDEAKLLAFYERVRPGTPWWGPIARRSAVAVDRMGWSDVGDWIAGLVLIYAGLFGVGKLILEGPAVGLAYLAIAAVAGAYIYRSVRRSPADL